MCPDFPLKKAEAMDETKEQIIVQIAALSRLLGMIPSNDRILIHEPITQTEMPLDVWLKEMRSSFLKLSVFVGNALDTPIR